MIHDSQTNTVYITREREDKYEAFFSEFIRVLNENEIPVKELSGTKDIWARDFMPVQVDKDEFVQFDFNPKYLRKKYEHLKTKPKEVKPRYFNITNSKIILDGGNVVKGFEKVIIADSVFKYIKEIPKIDSEMKLIDKLYETLKVKEIIIIPHEPGDFTGHADGLVRFKDDNTVLVSEHTNLQNQVDEYVSKSYANKLYGALGKAGLDIIQIPSFFSGIKNDEGDWTAIGNYINYLQVGHKVFIPQYYRENEDYKASPSDVKACDERAYKKFCDLFGKDNVITIDAVDVARYSGVLNCVTWNIYE